MEKGGERWSKPHVATLSLHSLFELRKCIEKGTIMLDMEASTLPQVVGELPAGTKNTQITILDSTSVPYTGNGIFFYCKCFGIPSLKVTLWQKRVL